MWKIDRQRERNKWRSQERHNFSKTMTKHCLFWYFICCYLLLPLMPVVQPTWEFSRQLFTHTKSLFQFWFGVWTLDITPADEVCLHTSYPMMVMKMMLLKKVMTWLRIQGRTVFYLSLSLSSHKVNIVNNTH